MEDATRALAAQGLETLRGRLLDLTARNRLLNFPHGRQGNVRVVNELPHVLHQLLFGEDDVQIRAVPEPNREQLIKEAYLSVDPDTGQDVRLKKDPGAEEWARHLGIDPSYTLREPDGAYTPPPNHNAGTIQALMFPYEMETRLRGLRARAETAIEETGANICYTAFGFLEWFESTDSDKPRHAPLLLVPVRIAKGRLNRETGTYHYTLAYTGEDILPNLSLREKLRIDFGLALPDVDELTTPEAYFAKVATIIATQQSRWRVRRWVTIALFNFSKLLMYLDLDPDRWPDVASITDHPIVSRFFGAPSDQTALEDLPEDYSIDDIAEVHITYPLVDDADASQHSALVDAVDGKNLVIEGPPGTGKSQTITNLIAAAMSHGKSVLFVAEKLAALEVVKRRLDSLRLGDFCLELHSHKTQKRQVLSDIAERLQKDYRAPHEIDADIARYEEIKEKLKGYAERINREWKRTGRSVHDILMAATRYRAQFNLNPVSLHPPGYDGDMFTPDVHRQSRDAVKLLNTVFVQVAAQLGEGKRLQSHPWFGVRNRNLQLFDGDRVCTALLEWQSALEQLGTVVKALREQLDCERADAFEQLSVIEALGRDIEKLPMLQGDECLSALPHLRGEEVIALEQCIALWHDLQENAKVLDGVLVPGARAPAALERLRHAGHTLAELATSGDTTLGALIQQLKRIRQLKAQFEEIGEPLSQVATALGQHFSEMVTLSADGLAEFRGLIEVASQLDSSLVQLRDDRFDDDALDLMLNELHVRITTLRRTQDEVSQLFALERLPNLRELDAIRTDASRTGLFRVFNAGWRRARRALKDLRSDHRMRVGALVKNLGKLHDYVREKQDIEEDARYKRALGPHFSGMGTRAQDLIQLRAWYLAVREHYGIGFGPRVDLGNTLLEADGSVLKGLRSLKKQGLVKRIDTLLSELRQIRTTLDGFAPLQVDTAVLVSATSPLEQVETLLAQSLPTCQSGLKNTEARLDELASVIACADTRAELLRRWEETPLRADWLAGRVDASIDLDVLDEATVDALSRTAALARIIDNEMDTESLRRRLLAEPTAETFASIRQLGEALAHAWAGHLRALDAYAGQTQLNIADWQRTTGEILSALMARNATALARPNWLSNWLDYVRVRHAIEMSGFAALADAMESDAIAPESLEDAYALAVNDLLAREILREVPELAQFSGNVQNGMQQQFREYDEKLKGLQRERIAARIAQNLVPEGCSFGRVSDYSERFLIQHECQKQRRHIPLRQLVQRAGNALVALKPCFMMGPMSVAQYLTPGQLSFDLVVMDEASQVKPEDALGCIARGAQIVVVGDPKQLPPTSFFDKMVEEEDADASTITTSESILDTSLTLFDRRRLKWHYRSRHEDLIAFSNHHFYGRSLVVFPSPHDDSPEFGVKLTRVPKGRFVNQRNLEEARVIAAAVKAHLLGRLDETLGVVAMSATQREQIERAIEELVKDDPQFQDVLERNQGLDEPLFVKNLENVQGDERDVIFISCTYGPEEVGGKVMQRFGPINSDLGWRRLNVLFTRSKKRMQVFSSMGAEDIIPTAQSRRGVHALKHFLAFAEKGHLHQEDEDTGRPPDSDFEIAVTDALRAEGFECVPQVGVAGFFIDVAVRDPGNPGRYLMGIECDGASYHSGKTVRDRDRLRQAVLERLGWRIRRIWSTDWYRNPEAELSPIVRELHQLKSAAPKQANAPQPVAPRKAPAVEDSNPSGATGAGAPLSGAKESESTTEQYEFVLQAPIETTGLSLHERLLMFDREIIRTKYPETPESQRLLRPAMIEALLEFQPITKSEFLEMIPPYLRQGTCAKEGYYLDEVLRLIEEAEA